MIWSCSVWYLLYMCSTFDASQTRWRMYRYHFAATLKPETLWQSLIIAVCECSGDKGDCSIRVRLSVGMEAFLPSKRSEIRQ